MKEHKGRMEDNRMIKDDHQEGISRKVQLKHEHEKVDGHQGKMGVHHKNSDGFKRADSAKSPRKA